MSVLFLASLRCILPDDCKDEFVVMGSDWDGNYGAGGIQDGEEKFTHPVTGAHFQVMVQNGERFIFDEKIMNWRPIPLLLEAFVPSISAAIKEIQEVCLCILKLQLFTVCWIVRINRIL